nr:HPP family protein [Salipiger mangrovisoli]
MRCVDGCWPSTARRAGYVAPGSPLSQPANVIGGHVVTSLVGLLMRLWLANGWCALALAVMVALGVRHPLAGANPLVVFWTDPGFGFLVLPVLVGFLPFVVLAVLTYFEGGQGVRIAGAFALDRTRDRAAGAVAKYFTRWVAVLAACQRHVEPSAGNSEAQARRMIATIQRGIVLARATGDAGTFDALVNDLRPRDGRAR